MKKTLLSFALQLWAIGAFAQIDALKMQIEQKLATKQATVGVGLYHLDKQQFAYINNEQHFPMQSVFKLHIAAAVLNEVDKGKFRLNQKIEIKKSDLLPNWWSPLRDKYPNGGKISLAKILEYTVSQSDNTGCDLLIRLIGGAQAVQNYMREIGVKDVQIVQNEEVMQKEWENQFRNWSTPQAAIELLKLIAEKKILKPETNKFLWKIMVKTSTGAKRLKGNLPAKTIVAHKTGTSGTKDGITAAINDIGVICLPTGERVAIVVFVSNSKESEEANEQIIAEIARLTYDFFLR